MKGNKITTIILLVAAVFVLSVAYAALSASLTITGTGNIDTTWDVGFDTTTTTAGAKTECTVTSKDSGKATTCTIGTKSATNISATIAWGSPGDVVTLKVRVNNNSTGLKASHSVSAKYYTTSSTSTACANVSATANYTVGATSGTAKTLTTSNQTIGPMTLTAGSYGMYTFVMTYSASATSAAGACTLSATGAATQVA